MTGDVVRLPNGDMLLVRAVAAGPGAGQYRMDCDPVRVIDWSE